MELIRNKVYRITFRQGRYELFDIQRVNGKMCSFMINVNDPSDCSWIKVDNLYIDRKDQLDLI